MYTVKVLSEADFDKLPYKHTKTSLGLADPATNTAYVRDTGYNDITKDTIAHELDELMAKTSPHEEDGIRYKNLKSLGAGAGAGLLSSFVPALRPFSPAISAGAGAIAADKGKRFQGAAQGFGGGGLSSSVGGGVFDAFKGVSQPGGTFGKALQAFVPGVQRGAGQFVQGIPGFGRSETGTPTGVLSKFFSGAGGPSATSAQVATKAGQSATDRGAKVASRLGIEQAAADSAGRTLNNPLAGLPGTVSAATSGAESTLAPKGNILGGIGDKFKDLFKGGGDGSTGGDLLKALAISGAGDLFAPQAQAPDTSGIQARLEELTRTGGEPIAKEAGLKELFRILGDPVGQPPEAAFGQGDLFADRQLTDDLEALRNEFKAVNPNANVDNNSAFLDKKQEIIRNRGEQRTAARDELSFQFEREQLDRKFQATQVALNLDQAQMTQYTQLAQMEVDQLMLQYGIDAQTAANFKQMFADLGRASLPNQGSGIDNFFNAAAGQFT